MKGYLLQDRGGTKWKWSFPSTIDTLSNVEESLENTLDVVGIGSSLVDVLATTTEYHLDELGLVKGSMELVDLARAETIYDSMGTTIEVSGGSVANTMAGLAALGGKVGFVGKVANDALGKIFIHDIAASGVEYTPIVAKGSSDEELSGTGRCLVLVTGDAERTMATHLGVATSLSANDVPEELIRRAQIVLLEGYLWDVPAAKDAMRRAAQICHQHNGSVAFSLSDLFCVDRHQSEFLDLLVESVDILFGNEEEILRLFEAKSFSKALEACEETGLLVAITRGASGSVVVTASGPKTVPATPVEILVDTTGAGDLYAAGFLYGLTHGADPLACAQLGGLCAAEVIGHLGARPQTDLIELLEKADIF